MHIFDFLSHCRCNHGAQTTFCRCTCLQVWFHFIYKVELAPFHFGASINKQCFCSLLQRCCCTLQSTRCLLLWLSQCNQLPHCACLQCSVTHFCAFSKQLMLLQPANAVLQRCCCTLQPTRCLLWCTRVGMLDTWYFWLIASILVA